MARYWTHTVEFKRRLVGEHLSSGVGLSELARRFRCVERRPVSG